MIPILSVVGRKNAGKTTLMAGLISALKRRGVRVAAFKHDVHGFQMDHEGKDTYKFMAAGADSIGICSPDRFARIERVEEEVSPDEFLRGLTHPADILLVEGYKRRLCPKVEVLRGAAPMFHRSPLLAATFGARPDAACAPHFEDPETLASHVWDLYFAPRPEPASCAVLAGGAGRRFQGDKPSALLGGCPLVEWVVRAVGPLFDEVFVVARDPAAVQSVSVLGVGCRGDMLDQTHSLGGIFSALKHAQRELVCVCACDAPFVQPRLLRALLAAVPGRDAAVCAADRGVEPFCGVYRKTCLPVIKEMLSSGNLRVQELFERVDCRVLSGTETEAKDPRRFSFLDIDTQEALRGAEVQLAVREVSRV